MDITVSEAQKRADKKITNQSKNGFIKAAINEKLNREKNRSHFLTVYFFGLKIEQSYPLWIRNIWTAPRDCGNWTFWQYTNRGRLKGCSGEEPYVDLNVFGGTAQEWEKW